MHPPSTEKKFADESAPTGKLTCFKAYDIRGRVPSELNPDIARRIGRAFAQHLDPGTVVVGEDVRPTSPMLADAVSEGLMQGGCDVIRIGLGGTEDVYFATSHLGAGGGIMVTASHNPADWNGMKFVREGSRPISGDSGLNEIRALAEAGEFPAAARQGHQREQGVREAYARFLLGLVDVSRLKPLRIVVNAGNGAAGLLVDELASSLPFEFIRIQHEPDGSFPHGVPNPLLPENRAATAEAVRQHGADMGIAWDGDYDRCFFFDERGEFIEGYYIVGLLAQAMLRRHPGARIVHDPRLVWNTIDIVTKAGGEPVMSRTGHAYIKEKMREVDAVYGGEMSAHHYFREFFYCDSGMIPWLMVGELLSASEDPLSSLVGPAMAQFPCSGEINLAVDDTDGAATRLIKAYPDAASNEPGVDGLSLEFPQWRLNVRPSNTEPLLRLNVEARGSKALLERQTGEVLSLLATGN
ncbi:MAG: phosphomannomutase [Chromatiales bacterium]|nr:phosphomannomutase [Chromatiales bacterium]